MLEEVNQLQLEYWKSFSYFDTWQFWIVVIALILPIIILFFSIDKRKMLLLGFLDLIIMFGSHM